MKLRGRRVTVIEEATDRTPQVYYNLFVDWLSVYLKRIRIPVATMLLAFGAVIIPGWAFRNPTTGSPPADIAYINFLGFFMISAVGYFFFRANEHAKNNQTADWNFAHITLEKVGLPFMPFFHFPHGPIVQLKQDEWKDVLAKIDLPPPERALLVEKSTAKDAESQPELNWFFFPKEISARFPLRGLIYGSRATEATKLYRHMNDLAVYEGYPRKNGNISYYHVGWLGDYPLLAPGATPDIVPVVIATGDHYNYQQLYETITKPVEVGQQGLLNAKLALAGRLVQDVMTTNQTLEQVVDGYQKNQFSVTDWAGRLAAPVIGALGIFGNPEGAPETRSLSRRTKYAIAVVIIAAVVSVGIGLYFLRG